MLSRTQRVATALWAGIAGGAAAGFVARDVVGIGQPLVAFAWLLGAAVPALALTRCGAPAGDRGRRARRRCAWRRRGPLARRRAERGQSTVEFVALVLLAALALGALAAASHRFDGRSFAGFLAHHVTCAMKRDCDRGEDLLARAYGPDDAHLVRDLAPNLVYERGERQLPVDWRHCRRPACAEARDERDLDVHVTEAGERATAFTRIIRRGGRTYLQYWLHYPDSKTVWASSDVLWEAAWGSARVAGLATVAPSYPGTHPDDWEAYAVRVDPGGRVRVRVSSHGGWQGCAGLECKGRWAPATGWTRVSRGSHAGHIPFRRELSGPRPLGPRHVLRIGMPHPRVVQVPLLPGHDLAERTTTAEGLRLVPLETLDARRYRARDESVRPPWQKDAYWDPESDES